MSRKFVFSFLLLTFWIQSSFANPSADTVFSYPRTISLQTGYINYGSIDELYSTDIYSGGGMLWSIGFEKKKKVYSRTGFNFSLFNRYPKNTLIDDRVAPENHRFKVINHLHLDISDRYFFPIKIQSERIELYALLQWFTSIDIIRNQSMMPELLLSSLAPGVFAEYSYGKHSIDASAATSLISYTCRSNYSNFLVQDYEKLSIWEFVKVNSRIQSPFSFRTLLLQFDYKYSLSPRWSVKTGYSFRYMHNDIPRTLKVVTGIYRTSFGYTF
jgi:hypothetical protein